MLRDLFGLTATSLTAGALGAGLHALRRGEIAATATRCSEPERSPRAS
jgi:hypothetical protein